LITTAAIRLPHQTKPLYVAAVPSTPATTGGTIAIRSARPASPSIPRTG